MHELDPMTGPDPVTGLDPVRALRAEISVPDAARLAAGRARLLAELDDPALHPDLAGRPDRAPSRTRLRALPGTRSRALSGRGSRAQFRGRGLLLPTGAAAAAAVAIAVALTVGSPTGARVVLRPGTSPGPGSSVTPGSSGTGPDPGPSASVHVSLAAQLLHSASATVSRQQLARPAGSQWFYEQLVDSSYGQGVRREEDWTTFDARLSAYYVKGRLVVHDGGARLPVKPKGTPLEVWDAAATPETAFDALAALPTDPEAVLAAVDRRLAALHDDPMVGGVFSASLHQTHQQQRFAYLANLLWNASLGAPPAAQAAVYEAMAIIPGIGIQEGISNVVGRPAVGLSADGGQIQLLLDPQSYQVIGLRMVSPGPEAAVTGVTKGLRTGKGPGTVPPKGTVLQSLATTNVTKVSGPGKR